MASVATGGCMQCTCQDKLMLKFLVLSVTDCISRCEVHSHSAVLKVWVYSSDVSPHSVVDT